MSKEKPISLWSGPRNVSTALMYSFARNDGISVVDEPLYGHYLRVTRADHPGRDEVLAAMNCDGDAVMRELIDADTDKRLFIKHMAHHLVDLDLGFLDKTCNVLLIRDPREMLPSLTIQVPQAGLAETGLKRQWQLYAELVEMGQRPAVLDARELLLDPHRVIARLCEHIGVLFTPDMLHWQAGPLKEDGVWAPHWYQAVHRSTGFAPYKPKQDFPDSLQDLLRQCKPWYDKLFKHAIRADTEAWCDQR